MIKLGGHTMVPARPQQLQAWQKAAEPMYGAVAAEP
jgi:hypothetical protein